MNSPALTRTVDPSYLRYYARLALRQKPARATLIRWVCQSKFGAARPVAGRSHQATCSTISTLARYVDHRWPKPSLRGQSSSPTTGPTPYRSATPSCVRSKPICAASWTSCSDRCRDVRSAQR